MPCPWLTTESRIAAWGATASAHRPREVKPVQSPRKSASRSLSSCQRLTRQTSTVFSRTDFRTVQGLHGYLRYVGYGVMSYNLHVIGRELLARGWARARPVRWAA